MTMLRNANALDFNLLEIFEYLWILAILAILAILEIVFAMNLRSFQNWLKLWKSGICIY